MVIARDSVADYAVALAAVVVAVAVRLLLDPLLGDRLPFISLFLAIVFVALRGRLGPALLTLLGGLGAASYFLLQPRYSLVIERSEDLVGLMLYGVFGLGVIAMSEAMAKKQQRLEAEIAKRRIAEQVLAEREGLLRVTFASIGDALITTDATGNIISLNAVAQTLTGWTQQEAYGQPLAAVFKIINEESRQPVENPVEKVMRERRVVGLANHTLLISKDGTERPIDDSAAPIRDDQGPITGIVLVFRDISERWEAERRLRQSEYELSDFFDNATIGLHWVGPDGTILRANQAELDLLGYQRAEYVGRSIADFHADNEVICDILKRLTDGEKLADYPARLRCKDGSIKDVLIDSSVLFRDGVFVHTRCFTRDVTERKRAEAMLGAQEQRTRVILESINEAFYAFDREWRFTYVNRQAQELIGRSQDELVGKDHWETFPDTLGTDIEKNYRRAMAEAVAVTFEIFYAPHDRWYEIHAYPSPDGLSVYFRDVSQRRRDHAALMASAQRLNLALSAADLGDWSWDAASDTVTFSERAAEIFGIPPGPHMTWTALQDLLHPEDRRRASAEVERVIAERVQYDIEYRVNRQDGSQVWVRVWGRTLYNDADQVVRMYGIAQDITDRKTLEASFRSSEERLRLALDAGRMGVWDWNIRTGQLKWSDSLEPLHGLAPGTFGGTFEHFQQLIYSEDRDAVNAAIGQALATGSEFYVEFRNLWQNGGLHWIAGSGKVFTGDDGQPLRMIGIGLDVTQRKRAEQTARFLAEASAALAELVDFDSTLQRVSSLAVPAFADWATVDLAEADGSLRRVSVSHVDRAKVELAHEVHRRFPPDPAAPQGVWNILRTGRSEIVPVITDELLVQSVPEHELLDILRELGLRSYIGVPLTVRGKVLGVITFINAESGHRYEQTDLAVAEDLASRAGIAIENAQLYQELRDADRRKDEFLATLAHELRNPLAPIRNSLELVKRASSNRDLIENARATMERQVRQMERLIDDLLDVSRITHDKLELKRERIELSPVVQHAAEACRPLAERSGHTLLVTLPQQPIYLNADPVRLTQVVGNLLTNACKYTEPNGRIWLTAERQGSDVAIVVKDTGIGIPHHMLPKVFDLFTQVDRSLERSTGGLGIGLSLVKRLVGLHGGTVTVHSEGQGLGSEFVVRLPMLIETPDQKPDIASELTPTTARRILVVDDNRDSSDSLAMLLKLTGHHTQTAYDGVDAVEKALAFRPEVILLDIGLPKMNGYAACRAIREQPFGKDVVIIALTGWGQDEDRRKSKEAGFDGHLVKPVDHAALSKLLASARRS